MALRFPTRPENDKLYTCRMKQSPQTKHPLAGRFSKAEPELQIIRLVLRELEAAASTDDQARTFLALFRPWASARIRRGTN